MGLPQKSANYSLNTNHYSIITNKLVPEHSQTRSFMLSLGAFLLRQHSWIVATETIRPVKLKNITNQLFTEQV